MVFDQNELFELHNFFDILNLRLIITFDATHMLNSNKYLMLIKLIYLAVCIQKSNQSIWKCFMKLHLIIRFALTE